MNIYIGIRYLLKNNPFKELIVIYIPPNFIKYSKVESNVKLMFRFHISESTILRLRKVTNTELSRGKKRLNLDVEKIKKMKYEEKYTLKELGNYFKCSTSTIKKRLEES